MSDRKGNRTVRTLAILIVAACAVAASSAHAAIQPIVSYQGFLTDTTGVPVTGSYTFTFRIYDAESGGSLLWEETHSGVGVTDGIFAVYLGKYASFDTLAFDRQYWLGVSADGVYTPRAQIGGGFYAMAAPRWRPCKLDAAGTVIDGTLLVGDGSIAGCAREELEVVDQDSVRVLLQSAGAATLYIVADTDNSSANDNAAIQFIERAGTATAQVGFAEGSRELQVMNSANDNVAFGTSGVRRMDIANSALVRYYAASGARTLEVNGDAGAINVYAPDDKRTLQIAAETATGRGGGMAMYERQGEGLRIHMGAEDANGTAFITMKNAGGNTGVSLDAEEAVANGGGQVWVWNGNGSARVKLFGSYDGSLYGRVVTDVLEITGGSDFSERFEVRSHGQGVSAGNERGGDAHAAVEGMVVRIDPEAPGQLTICDEAYDARVAGVISGAGGVMPGMVMGQAGSQADGTVPVALSGRVYCWVDASYGAITPGDLLTSSETPGMAMVASDASRRAGAVLGKAMTGRQSGRGLVLVLVSLQ